MSAVHHMDETDLAKVAYHAYGQTTDFKNYQGLPMPEWDNLMDKIRAAWVSAVKVAIQAYITDSYPPETEGQS